MPSGQHAMFATSSLPFLITFSGIDGGGKTTQISDLEAHLERSGLRVLRLSFWDHVAVWPHLRARVGDRALDLYQPRETGRDAFAPRNHKHIRRWYLTAARSVLYLLDILRLRRLLASPDLKAFDVVIFDRYVYDQLANIDSRSFLVRLYRRMLLKLTKSPDLAFILDASPDAAFARKPEYPLEFMRRYRRNFLGLSALTPELIIISHSELDEVRSEIQSRIGRSRLAEVIARRNDDKETGEVAVVRPQSSCRGRNEPTPIV